MSPAAPDEEQDSLADFLTLSRNVIYNIASQTVVGVTGLATIPILTRSLEIEEYAFFSFLLLFLTSMTVLEGLRPPFIQLIHEYEEKEAPRAFLRVAAGVNLGFAAAMCAVAFFAFRYLGPQLADPADSLFVAIGVFFLFAGSLPSAAVAAAQQIGLVQLSRSTAMAGTYVSFVGLAVLDTGVEYFTASMAAFQAILVATYVVLAFRHYAPRLAERESSGGDGVVRTRRVLSQCLDGLITGVSGAVDNFADRLMVYLLVSAAAYATYSLAYDIGIRLAAIALMVGYPLFTLLSERLRQGDDYVYELYAGVAKATLFAMMLMAVSGIYWAHEILLLFGGQQYAMGESAFQAVLFATLVSGLTVVSVPFLRAVGDFRSQWIYKLLGGGVTMGLAWWWIGELGIVGGGLALIAGRLCSNVSLVAVTKTHLQEFGPAATSGTAGMQFRIIRWFVLSLIFCLWAGHPLSGGVLEFGLLALLVCTVSIVVMFTKRDLRQALRFGRHLCERVGSEVRDRLSGLFVTVV